MSNSDRRVIDELSELAGQLLVSQLPGTISATQLQGRDVATTAPADTYVLTWVASTAKWTPVAAASGGGVAIGGAVAGGTAGRVLFEGAGPGPVVADSPNLTFLAGVLGVLGTATIDTSGAGDAGYFTGVAVRGHGASLILADTAAVTDPFRISNAFSQLFISNVNTGQNLASSTPAGNWAFGSANSQTNVRVLVAPTVATEVGLVARGVAGQTAPLEVFQGISSTGTVRDLGYLDAGFTVSTDATYSGFVALSAIDWTGTRREGIRVAISGTQALVTLSGSVSWSDPATARTNLGLGTIATHPTTDFLTPTGDGSGLTGIAVGQVTGAAPLASPTFTGTPAGPTPATADNSTKLATTAWVQAQAYLTAAPVTSVATRTGAIVLTTADIGGLGTLATQAASAVAITGGTVSGITLGAHAGTRVTSNSGAFDLSAGDWFFRTLDGTNGTLSVSNEQVGQMFGVELLQDATGARVVTFFTTITWMTSGGIAPTVATAANLRTTFAFKRTGAGTYLGWLTGSQS